jgi:hypothetical protein
MQKIVLIVTAAAAVVTGCSASSPAPTPTPTPTVSERPRTGAARPDAEQAVIDALTKVDPRLTENTDRAVRRAKRVCDSVGRYEGNEAKGTDYTRQEFDGGTVTVDAGKAVRILAAIRSSGLCG